MGCGQKTGGGCVCVWVCVCVLIEKRYFVAEKDFFFLKETIMFFFNVSWTFVLVFLLVLGSDYRIPLSHHVLVAASTICAFPIWTATARAVVM